MENKKSKKGLLILIIILIVTIIGILCLAYFKNNGELLNNNKEIKEQKKISAEELNTEKEELNKKLEELTGLSPIIVNETVKNYNKNGKYEIPSETDLLADLENRQALVMNQILRNQDNYDNFIIFDAVSGKETKGTPNDQITYSYYPYDLYNEEYKLYFNKDFDINSTKEYNNKKYVSYSNENLGLNGVYITSIVVDEINYNDNKYISKVTINYSDRAIETFGYNETKAELSYQKIDDQMILESFIIK